MLAYYIATPEAVTLILNVSESACMYELNLKNTFESLSRERVTNFTRLYKFSFILWSRCVNT